MRRGLASIIGGLFLIFLSIYLVIIYQNSPAWLFTISMNSFALMIILTGIFQYMNYYNFKIYFGLTGLILVIMLTLSYFQISVIGISNVPLALIIIGIFMVGIIWLAHKVNQVQSHKCRTEN